LNPELIFELASSAAILGWLLLTIGIMVRPSALKRILLLVGGRAVPILLCIVYLALLINYWGSAPGGNFGSLEGVAQLFSSRGKLLGGWLHYLAFDLFIGRWIIDDTINGNRSRIPMALTLPLTFLFGPVGLLFHFAVRGVQRPTPNAVALPRGEV
jgi:hypothetical protein